MVAIKSSDFQKNVGLYLDKLNEGPVRISRYDRPAAVLVSARYYEELVSSYRKAIRAEDLTNDEMAMIRQSRVETSRPFDLADLPEAGLPDAQGRTA
jgi:prevent-host-death family protein